jgi:hypothetical protein
MGGGTSMTGGCKGISNFLKKSCKFSQFFYLKNLIFTYAKDFFNEKGAYIPQRQTPKKGSI